MIQLELLLPPTATFRYDDTGEPAYSTWERLLMTMRWLEWPTIGEIYDAMCADDSETRADVAAGIRYFVRKGKIAQRGAQRHQEYMLIASAFPKRATGPRCARCCSAAAPGKASCQRHLDYDAGRNRKARAA